MTTTKQPRILVAGIGNVFLGDDAFGVEVARCLQGRSDLPECVRVVDYGIRGFDLAFALLEPWDAVVLCDAASRGEPPGTVYVIEADVGADAEAARPEVAPTGFEGHLMTPGAVFALVRSLGGDVGKVTIVACEPESFGEADEGRMGLSEPVAAAVPIAVERVLTLVRELVGERSGGSVGA